MKKRVRVGAVLLGSALMAVAPASQVGVEMPAAGDDGARGIAVATAVRLALQPERVVARDSANGGFLNAHRDEGSDNGIDRANAPSIIAAFARDPHVVAAIGGLRRNVGDADAAAAQAHGLPVVVLARWWRNRPGGFAFCTCASPPRIVSFARNVARERFGRRLLLVLIGEAGTLPVTWPNRFGDASIVRVTDAAASVDAARRRVRDADAVLVIADERPPTLWRSSAFRRGFDAEYVRRLGHRDFESGPAGTPRGEVVVLRQTFPDSPARRAFARRFHAAAGFIPGAEPTLAYAVAQILRAAGTSRATVRSALRSRRFDTVAGSLAFDADGYLDAPHLAAADP